MSKPRYVAVLPLLLLAACAAKKQTPPPEAETPPPHAAIGSFGVDLTAMDTSVKPGDDFYGYVNGKWLASFEIPADRAAFGSGAVVNDKTEADLKAIVEGLAATKPAAGTVAQKVVDLYSGWMDQAGIETRGTAPLQPFLQQISAVSDKGGIAEADGHGRLQRAVRCGRRAGCCRPDAVLRVGVSAGPGHARS